MSNNYLEQECALFDSCFKTICNSNSINAIPGLGFSDSYMCISMQYSDIYPTLKVYDLGNIYNNTNTFMDKTTKTSN